MESSTFLSSDVKFDVIVFDEASQIFPQDAIGAIYRGNQLIVAFLFGRKKLQTLYETSIST